MLARHSVVGVVPTTETSMQLLHVLEQQGHIKFWKEPTALNRLVSFEISEKVYKQVRPIFAREAMSPITLIKDIQK